MTPYAVRATGGGRASKDIRTLSHGDYDRHVSTAGQPEVSEKVGALGGKDSRLLAVGKPLDYGMGKWTAVMMREEYGCHVRGRRWWVRGSRAGQRRSQESGDSISYERGYDLTRKNLFTHTTFVHRE